MDHQPNRRRFLSQFSRAVSGTVLVSAVAGTYAVALEPEWLEVRKVGVPIPGLDPAFKGLRILQISDIHRSSAVTGDFVRTAVDLALEQRPELIALTGDFITRDHQLFTSLARELAPLAAAAPTFAVPGNHDYDHFYPWERPRLISGGQQLGEALAGVGIHLLRNERTSVAPRTPEARLEVVGLDDFWSPNFDPVPAFSGASESAGLRIVLSHNPDSFRAIASQRFDLMLAGHTHGGQVRLPVLGAPVVPIEDRRFIAGLVAAEERLVYVNRGLGFNRRIRFGVRPEITLLELHPA